jgi:(1->4)-alpha-D-glucan 1-alpha-D-glucosylmutase
MPREIPSIPCATYRLQFNSAFSFSYASSLVPYLHALGITHCYASSYLKAVPGSPHGYDIADPTSLSPEIGSETDYRHFAEALAVRGMGQILDVVPNHMGIAKSSNRWWTDVLENGPSSRFASFFDIDWHPVKVEIEDKVLLPILGELYGYVLENQEITLRYEDGAFFIRYADHTLPIAPRSFLRILTHRLDDLIRELGEDDAHVQELQSIVTSIRHLPGRSERDHARVQERYREKEIIKRRLRTVVAQSPAVRTFLKENVRLFNGTKGDSKSFHLLDGLLADQAYRLAYWGVASEEINYRRFFDINELAAIRMEDPAVFAKAHELIFRLLRDGSVTGLRIDHVDGLYNPQDYLQQLQDWTATHLHPGQEVGGRPLYVIVEKIFGKGEHLPETWPVYGTTGYDFLNLVNGLFVDPAHERPFNELYTRFIRARPSYEELVYQSKKLIMRGAMASEINVLGHQLNRLSERDRRTRDFTLNNLTVAIRETIACFPVYRTYITTDSKGVSDRDRAYVRLAVAKAKRRNPQLNGLVFDFVRKVLLEAVEDHGDPDWGDKAVFVMKFQQLTSPVAARGVEDTALYVYSRLLSLNEVGGDPERFGIPPSAFHERMRERQPAWPASLSATSTHDTKRSEDVRARINVLSELPKEWRTCLVRWQKMNQRHKQRLEDLQVPDRNEEYLLYQTLLGAWPLGELDDETYRTFRDRIQAYMAKSVKEAKVHTSWTNPNEAHAGAVASFIAAVLDRTRPNPFLEDFRPFQQKIAEYGMYNSLAQVLIKIAAPGVPDFYQGTELWDFSLVDPDNRRPVDYALRGRLLSDLQRSCANAGANRRGLVRELLESRHDGRIKLYVTMAALDYRRKHPSAFRQGEYLPLETRGSRQEHAIGFARRDEDQVVLLVVPRLTAGLLPDPVHPPIGHEVWDDTGVLAPKGAATHYRNILTGEVLPVQTRDGQAVLPLAEVLGVLPVALLEADGPHRFGEASPTEAPRHAKP